MYILLCDQKTYYVGITNDVNRRLKSHKLRENIATKEFSDVEVVCSERLPGKKLAAKRERQIKGWSRAKKIALIQGNLELLKKLSKL